MRSQHRFSQTPSVRVPRSSFNLSHGYKTTFDADYLVPICKPIDIIPGDTFNVKTSFFMRLATPLYPILDNLFFETFAFFVPYRTIWDNHEKFHGAQDDPGDSISFTVPLASGSTAGSRTATGSLWDYFGLPIDVIPDDVDCCAFPYRAYVKIYNDWFRDQNMQDSIVENTGDGPDVISDSLTSGQVPATPFKRGKRHDYFTSCLPEPQRGTGVSLPLGTSAPVGEDTANQGIQFQINDGASSANLYVENDGNVRWSSSGTGFGSHDLEWGDANLIADLTGATASSVNDIRLAFATQHILERDARSGTRYVENLKARWGVTSPDFRLQRAEYLGGGSSRVNVSPVAQTSGQPTPAADDKLGNLAAVGSVNGTHSWSKSFVEHGVVIILGNLRGDITYSQGIDRYWTKSTRYDFMYPEMVNLGEQAVLNKEIWVTGTGTPATDDLVFGYQGRYDEYRYINSTISGLMRPDASGTLAAWHLSEDFASLPSLGDTFIKANTATPLDRAIAIPTEPHMYADIYHNIRAARPLPTYGVPGLTRL